MVAGRDFVTLNGVYKKGNLTFLIAKSIPDYDEKFPPKGKIVRGEMIIGKIYISI